MRLPWERSWGRYRLTSALASRDAVDSEAHFQTRLPHADLWTLDYHYPQEGFPVDAISIDTDQTQDGAVDTISRRNSFLIEVSTGGSSRSIEMEYPKLVFGWNQVGRFDLGNEDVVVTVKPNEKKTSQYPMWVFADAIRWTPSR